jgi:hypothetical protein
VAAVFGLTAGLSAGRPGLGLGIAYFYMPPSDGTSAAFLAHHFQLIIMTHPEEPYMAQLRHAGFTGPVLQYIAANEAEGPGPYANASAACDRQYPTYQRTVADRVGVFCAQIHPHEHWFLHNRRGERLWSRYRSGDGVWRTTYAMNPGSAGWRAFLIHRLRQYRPLGYDGFFFDNVDLSRSRLFRQTGDRGGLEEYATQAAFRRAEEGYLAAVRAAFPHVPIWANLTVDPNRRGDWQGYLRYLNGVMVEDFALGWNTYPLPVAKRLAQLANIRAALGAGKSVLLVEQGKRRDRARLGVGLALAWALAADAPGRVYFRYGDSGDEDYRTVWWYRAYRFQPPAPVSPLRCGVGVCRRDYAQGVLRVDLAQGRAELPAGWPRF